MRVPQPAMGDAELNIVPFLDIVTNLLLFLLATTASVVAVAEVSAQLPSIGPCRSGECPRAIDVSVVVGDRAIWVSGSGAHLAPGCERTASGEATIARGGEGAWTALSDCMATLRARFPDAHQVTLSADPGVPYEDLVRAMDAVRARGDELLFDEVRISAGVR